MNPQLSRVISVAQSRETQRNKAKNPPAALLARAARAIVTWVAICFALVFLVSRYARPELAAPVTSLLDDLTLLLPLPFLTLALLNIRHGDAPRLRVAAAWLLLIGIPANVLFGLLTFPALVYDASHSFLFPTWTFAGYRITSGLMEPVILGAAVPAALFAHLWSVKRATDPLRSRAQALQEQASAADLQRQLAEAKLSILQAQIEPHFLYNTLANVQLLIAERPGDAARMVSALIRYLRETLPRLRDSASTLGREVDVSLAYLEIMQIRLGERLSVGIAVPDELRAVPFPPLIVLTLVENAIKHGVERKPGPVRVDLRVTQSHGSIEIAVADDGAGLQLNSGGGIGLRNVRERLAGLYGDAASLHLAPGATAGVTAIVRIPAPSAASDSAASGALPLATAPIAA